MKPITISELPEITNVEIKIDPKEKRRLAMEE